MCEKEKIVISVNPIAGARSAQPRIERLVDLLGRQGFRLEVLSNLDQVAELANRWHAEGCLRALIGVGGDGTAAELVNRTAVGLPLTMLSAGNENLLARYLGLGNSPEDICRTVVDGHLVRLDVGKANGRLFLLMLGCGFDAEVVRRVHDRRRGHIRSRNYFKPILEAACSYRYPELRLHYEDNTESPQAVRWLFAFNLPCYGGRLPLAPQAVGTDGQLDICAFRRGSLLSGLRYAAAVYLHCHQRMADCTTARVRRVRITSDAEVPYQLDGDPGGLLPVEVGVVPRRLAILVPGEGRGERRSGIEFSVVRSLVSISMKSHI